MWLWPPSTPSRKQKVPPLCPGSNLQAKKKSETASVTCALEGLLLDLAPVAEKAVADMGANTDPEDVAAHAVKVNVFHTIDFLLKYSAPIREKVRSGQVEIQGAVYHLDTRQAMQSDPNHLPVTA